MTKKEEPSYHIVRRKLADGTYKEYVYERRRNLPNDPERPLLERPEPGTVQHLVNAFKHSVEWRSFKSATQQQYAHYLKWWERIAEVQVVEVRRKHILSMRSKVAERHGHAAANNFVRATASWCSWMLQNEWIEHSPALRIPKLPTGSGFQAWTNEQFNRALHTFPEPLRRVIVLARYTGQRRGDLVAMRWSDYKDGVLSVTQQKAKYNSKPITLIIPVHNTLRVELERWKSEALSVFVLVTEKRRPWAPEYLSWSIGTAVRDAGLPPGLNVHGLRKLAASTFADLGCSPHEIKAITGHRTLAMVEYYTRSVSQEHLAREAMDRWERNPSFTKIGRIYRSGKDE